MRAVLAQPWRMYINESCKCIETPIEAGQSQTGDHRH